MEILLKKLYIRRMAADIGITRIYASRKMVGMESNMSKKVFKVMADSMSSDIHKNSGFLWKPNKEVKKGTKRKLLT
ncbi:hypothetical protein D5086_005646 [Populus alba]|uniref:Uncharacterized protein n=1 Tax=Populus alba TaxID=43335 RepID=A0ACC4CV82_POPAL